MTGNPAYNQNPPLFDNDLVTRSSLVCGGGKLKGDDYNLGLHVMALFVVLTQSTLGKTHLKSQIYPGWTLPNLYFNVVADQY